MFFNLKWKVNNKKKTVCFKKNTILLLAVQLIKTCFKRMFPKIKKTKNLIKKKYSFLNVEILFKGSAREEGRAVETGEEEVVEAGREWGAETGATPGGLTTGRETGTGARGETGTAIVATGARTGVTGRETTGAGRTGIGVIATRTARRIVAAGETRKVAITRSLRGGIAQGIVKGLIVKIT